MKRISLLGSVRREPSYKSARTSKRRVRTTASGLVIGLMGGLVGSLVSIVPASAQSLVFDGFNQATTTSPVTGLNSATPGRPCLTAGTNTSSSPIGGCNFANPDPAGSGVLHLTDASNDQASAILYNSSFPLSQGLTVEFSTYMYGSTGSQPADGISFSLAVAPPQPTAIGQNGG